MIVKKFKEIGERVREERKKQGLTQGQLAGFCRVGVRFIVDLEAGKETCQVGKVLYVIEQLGLVVCLENR